jgi:hypothetical protein
MKKLLSENNAQRLVTLFSLCIALNAIVFTVFPGGMPIADDIGLYLLYARRTLSGQVPYRDFFIEYPPISLLFFIPAELVVRPFGELPINTYQPLFYLQNFILTTGTLWLTYKILLKFQPELSFEQLFWRLGGYTLGCILLSLFLFQRYDIAATFLTFLAVYLLLHQRPGWAGGILALAAACKLFPAIILPVFLLYYWRYDPFRLRSIGRCVVAFSVTGLVTTLPFFLLSSTGFLKFLSYHSDRGIEVETIFASFIFLAHYFNFISATITTNALSIDLASPWSRPLATFSSLLTVTGLIGLYFYFWRTSLRTEYNEPSVKTQHTQLKGFVYSATLIQQVSILILWFILANKVISPQYLIWLLPFAALWKSNVLRLLFVGAVLLTSTLFPFLENQIFQLQPLPFVIAFVRNVLLIAIFIGLLRGFSEPTQNERE